MSDPRLGAILRDASRFASHADSPTTDAALLGRLARGDSGALAELVERHGPNVWALCRRLVRAEPDAEDVFQATFLVLARDASRVRKAASVGSWLFGVATRIGGKVREKARRTPDPKRLARGEPPRDPAAELSWAEVRAALDEELGGLADELRAPLLLCYFEGMTQDEAAAELKWSPRTLKARVARGRDQLRRRLTRRGIELPAALAVPLLSAEVAPAVPPQLLAALVARLSSGPAGAGVSPAAVRLAQTETHTVASLRLAILVVSAAGLLAAGTLVGSPSPPSAAPANTEEQNPPRADEPALPPGAVRIGSSQVRQTGWHSRVFLTDGGKTVVSAGEGAVVRFWDLETGKTFHQIALEGSYEEAAFSHAANLLAVVGWHRPDGEDAKSADVLWLIDTATRKHLRTVRLPERRGGNSRQVRVSADGKRVVVEYEGDIQVIDAKSGDELLRHKGRINAGVLALSPDGKTIAFGRYDVFVWHWESGEEPKKLASIRGFGTETVAFSGDGKRLYVAVEGGRVLTFEVATGRETASFDVGASPWKWSLSPDGKTLAIAYHDSKPLTGPVQAVVLWDPATGKEKGRLPAGRSNATAPSWSPDGTRLAAATDYRLWVWDVATGRSVGPATPGHEGFITAFAFSPDGRLFTASDDHTVRSWDAATGKPGFELVHDAWVRGMALSPDGSLLAGSALRNDLRIWDAKTGTEKFRLLGNGQMGGKRKVQFTPDGKRLVAWGDDMYLRVWDMRNGKLLAEHRTLPEGVTEEQLDDERSDRFLMLGLGASDISADGSTFALCNYKVAQIFDVETGKERARFEIDPNGVSALGLSPDGKRLAVGGRGKHTETRLPDGSVRGGSAKEHQFAVWDIATKTMTWKAMTTGVWSSEVRFSPDGKLVGESAGSDRKYTIRVWKAETGKEYGQIVTLNGGSHFAFDKDAKRLAVSHSNTTATIYDLETALKPSAPK
jgi:RNA polymerase sigma factor (sigma-70 family)